MTCIVLLCCVFTLFWSMTLTLGYKIPCPQQCSRCYRNNTGDLIKVMCTDIVIPSLPETIQQIQVFDAVSAKTLPLGQLKAFIFTKRMALEKLVMQNYKISSIEDGCFRNNINLRTLDLSKNMITSLTADAFEGLVNLTFLNLNQNRLASLKHSIFVHLSNLRELRIALNWFVYIGKHDFLGLNNLIKLDLQANYIASIHPQAFNSVSHLRDLDLQHNKLEVIEAGIFRGLNSLQTINLKNNHIISLEPGCMSSNSLTMVNLIQNNILAIPKAFLVSVSSKELEVYLARNKITEIKMDDLNGVHLKSLSLVSNTIWSIEPYAFVQSNIAMIDLEQNQLITLPSTVHSYLNASHVIRLGNNPWSCDCNIQWLAKFLKSHVTTSQQPVCAKPDEFHGKKLSEIVDKLSRECKMYDSFKTSFYIPPKQSLVTPELHTVPPTYPWITPRLRSTTVSTTTVNIAMATTTVSMATKLTTAFPVSTNNQTLSTAKQLKPNQQNKEGNNTPIIIGVCISVIIILCVIIVVIIYKVVRARAAIDTELSVQCRKPDVNYRPRMSRISMTWFDEVT